MTQKILNGEATDLEGHWTVQEREAPCHIDV